jgi:uncharacterized protein YjiS (DUF1127 family)
MVTIYALTRCQCQAFDALSFEQEGQMTMRQVDCTDTIAAPAPLAQLGVERDRALPYGVGDALRNLVDRIMSWHERSRQRRHLAGLSDHMLRDIGLSRGDVCAECEKPFWRL